MAAALGVAELPSRRMYAVRMGRWKLITSPDGVELYDLHEDPGETTDLHAARPDEAKRLSAALRDELAGRAAPRDATEPASRRELEALRALGYIK